MTDEESALLVARALEEGSGVREVAGSLIKRAFAKKSEDNLTAIVGLLDYGEADPRSGWLASLREKQAGAAAEAKKAADLAKVKAASVSFSKNFPVVRLRYLSVYVKDKEAHS